MVNKNKYSRIVLNIPHSSTEKGTFGWDDGIGEEIEKWTDTYTDILFASSIGNEDDVIPVVANVSRFFCDVERLIDDPLEETGHGIFYTSFNGHTRKKEHILFSQAMQYWWAHQERLSRAMCENCLIIDCHSFPTELAPDVDVCIGFNEGLSMPKIDFLSKVCKFFKEYGYRVRLNEPYSNSITPHEDFFYNSMMIELNKSLYLNEDGTKKASMYKVNHMLKYLYNKILKD